MELGKKGGTTLAVLVLAMLAIGSGARSEDKFQKLTGAQIQAKLGGMEVSDQVHWSDVYQRNGALVTYEMGHKSTGTWRVRNDQLCLDRGKELGTGCYEVWLSGNKVQLKGKESRLPLDGVLQKPTDRH